MGDTRMTEYTPTMSELRKWWAEDQNQTWGQDEDSHAAEFDRALAAHDAEVAANALRDAANEWHEEHFGTAPRPYFWLTDRADRIEREATNRDFDCCSGEAGGTCTEDKR